MSILLTGSNWVSCGDNHDTTNNMTVTAWIRRDSTGSRDEIISKESSLGSGLGWEFSVLGSNVLEFGTFNGSYPVAVGATTISANTTYFVVGIRDGTTEHRVYVNGVEDGSGGVPTSVGANTSNLLIGASPVAGGREFGGYLEDIRLYTRVLSDNEIQALSTARGSDHIVNGLQSRWKLNHGSPGTSMNGISLRDVGIAGIHGSSVASPTHGTFEFFLVRPRARRGRGA
jgi:hypothetical protein